MKLKNISYSLYLFIFFTSINLSQSFNLIFEDYSVDENMPTMINCIFQDRTGFLWFATNSGLYKYDGYTFTSFRHDPDDSTSLIDNTLNTIFEDASGNLWIGTWLGLEKFNSDLNKFTHYTPAGSDTINTAGNNVWAICDDGYGFLWIGTTNGLYKFDTQSAKFSGPYHINSDQKNSSVQALVRDINNSIWIGTDNGLDRFDFVNSVPDTNLHLTPHELQSIGSTQAKYRRYWNIPQQRYKPGTVNSRVNSILIDEEGILWAGSNSGLIELDPGTGKYYQHHYSQNIDSNRITSICRDVTSGNIWAATPEGLSSFNTISKNFVKYNSRANYVYKERSGTLWIGTHTNIRKINRTRQPFRRYSSKDMILATANGGKGIVWMFTLNGWLKFDTNLDQFIPYSFGKDYLFFVWNNADITVRGLDGSLRILDTLGNETFSLDPSWNDHVNSASFGWITRIGYLSGCDDGTVELWDSKTNKIIHLGNLKLRIHLIYEDSYGLIWLPTYMGNLYFYDPSKKKFTEYLRNRDDPSGFSGSVINQIYEDKKRRLWFASSNGLFRYNRAENNFTHYTQRQGFPSINIRGILEDDHGNLWISTIKGISKFNPETKQLKNYDASYGIEQSADIFLGIGCRTANGDMYFGGAHGFTRFHPDEIKDNPFIPPVVLTSFKVFDRNNKLNKEIHLRHDENFISFEFAALSYVSPEKNQYAYMMEGIDHEWVYAGTRRYASYPNISPGKYIFRVKASNNDGIWNEAGTSILLNIAPPLWKTTWAYIFYFLFIISIIYLTWKAQVNRIRIKHSYEMTRFEADKLHEVDEMKSRFFANISHEFRTPLTLILGPVKQLIENIKDDKTYIDGRHVRNELKVVYRNGVKLLALVNQLLDLSKLESGNMKLQASPQNIIPLLRALLQSFCSYAERKKITVNFNTIINVLVVYVDTDKFEKIITNILSNAFKFTPEGGKIELNVNSTIESAEISISDSGIGISEDKISKIFDRFYQVDGSHTREQEGTGIGLSLTKELVELHKGKIEVISEKGKGTIFKLSFPLGREHFKPEEIMEKETPGKSDTEPKDISDNDKNKLFLPGIEMQKPESGIITDSGKPLLLVVEDNSDVRNYIKNNLCSEYYILEAVDGEDGWNQSISEMPDLIISDVMMPKLDGFKLCDKLKKDERTSHIPVILLTAKASTDDKIEGFQTGADDYIMKPFDNDELMVRIKNLIEQRKRIHDHFRRKGIFEIDQTKITSLDKSFLQKVFRIINVNISDSDFSLDTFAGELNISKSLLHKKVLSLTGEPPGELMRKIRLNKAAELIKNQYGNISQVAYEVGFNNPAYFSECFKKQFGVSPSHYS